MTSLVLMLERMSRVGQVRMKVLLMIFIIFFALSQHEYAKAEEPKGKSQSEILSHVQNAFDAQISLTEKPRSKEEMNDILEEFFVESFINVYFKENVESLNNQYIVYGTDLPKHTIPFFQYDGDTVIEIENRHAMVYEYFEANHDGPVSYEDHYEVVFLKKINNDWKVSKIENDVNKPTLKKEPSQNNSILRQEVLMDINKVNMLSISESVVFNHNDSIDEFKEILFLSTYLFSKELINAFNF